MENCKRISDRALLIMWKAYEAIGFEENLESDYKAVVEELENRGLIRFEDTMGQYLEVK